MSLILTASNKLREFITFMFISGRGCDRKSMFDSYGSLGHNLCKCWQISSWLKQSIRWKKIYGKDRKSSVRSNLSYQQNLSRDSTRILLLYLISTDDPSSKINRKTSRKTCERENDECSKKKLFLLHYSTLLLTQELFFSACFGLFVNKALARDPPPRYGWMEKLS